MLLPILYKRKLTSLFPNPYKLDFWGVYSENSFTNEPLNSVNSELSHTWVMQSQVILLL